MKLGNLDQNSSQRYVVYNSLCEAPALLAVSGQGGVIHHIYRQLKE